uniref:Zinc knuckle CX2CX4HX4C domain-containing protein n=1 Tax=Cannabis sativa TaxID=3483 RepID=A0A803QNH4_CANSA
MVKFKYEDLPTFYFICGVLRHSERFIERLFETPLHLIDKPYGLELKALPRRRHYNMGAQWLRSGVAKKTGESSSTGDAQQRKSGERQFSNGGNQLQGSRISQPVIGGGNNGILEIGLDMHG